ncbi:ATP-binding protein [Streptomyces odontomachi]|uniref:ATP-binding protein n=1 Tax=Streptomyces odontomachi TaxID=2944940 RepID=UPI00210D4BE6|nr:ATP-binding protein [Streptomyces sp. ODS25]
MLENAVSGAGGAVWGAGAVGCHVPKGTAVHEPPGAESLSYSFTLPAGPHNARIARQVARNVLAAHGLEELHDAAVQVVSELAACAWRFTPTPEVYVCLRYRGEALRVIVYDGHPRHTNPRLAATCDGQRKASLRLAAAVVKACQGEWGFGDAREPGGGTRMWAVLPHVPTVAFGRPERAYRKAARGPRA